MELFEALRTRRTATIFGTEAPSRDLLQRLIDAATWAPNHRLTQPWRFHVLAGPARERLADAIEAWYAGPDAPPDTPAQQGAAMRAKLLRSPVIVVVIQTGTPDDLMRDREDYAACCCATQNLLLAAHAEGLAAKWSTGKLAAIPPAREHLALGPADRIVAYVYLGAAMEAPPAPPVRHAPPVTWDGFDQ